MLEKLFLILFICGAILAFLEKIILDVSEWAGNASAEKIREYAISYPKTIQEIANEVIG